MKRYEPEEITDEDGTYDPDMVECSDGAYVLYEDVLSVLRKIAQDGSLDKEAMNIILDVLASD